MVRNENKISIILKINNTISGNDDDCQPLKSNSSQS